MTMRKIIKYTYICGLRRTKILAGFWEVLKKKYTAFMDYNRMICEIARVEKKKTELNCKMRDGANGGRF